jgi:hypothetical protein
MKGSSVVAGTLALLAASMSSLPDSTGQASSHSGSMFTDKAPNNVPNDDRMSVIDHGSVYGTVEESILDDLEPPPSTLPRTRRKRRDKNNVEPTIVMRPTMTMEPLPPTKRDSST